MIRDIISSVLSTLAPAADDSQPQYDFEYLSDCEYKYIKTFADRDGQDVIRCDICGHYFQPSEICDAFDHVSDRHGDHTEGDIDALAEAPTEEAHFDYSDLLQETPDDMDDMEPASN